MTEAEKISKELIAKYFKPEHSQPPAVEQTPIPDVINQAEKIGPTIEPIEAKEPFVIDEDKYKIYFEKAKSIYHHSHDVKEMIHYTKRFGKEYCEIIWPAIAKEKYSSDLSPWADQPESQKAPVIPIEKHYGKPTDEEFMDWVMNRKRN